MNRLLLLFQQDFIWPIFPFPLPTSTPHQQADTPLLSSLYTEGALLLMILMNSPSLSRSDLLVIDVWHPAISRDSGERSPSAGARSLRETNALAALLPLHPALPFPKPSRASITTLTADETESEGLRHQLSQISG